ncbi:uncharacterized protein [Euwallacea fornicatus]|uniref:uncharacterized protein n=1 Tax=Euwallacea fornicatus TaxID=995702 RepID=UPI00338E5E27
MCLQIIVMTGILYTSLLIGGGFGQETSSLSCFDCNPKRHPNNECANPIKNAVQYVNCEAQFPERPPNTSLICVSTNITFYGNEANKTGIYRGCEVQNESIIDYCDWFKEEINDKNGALISCDFCNTTRCNNLIYDEIPNASDQISSSHWTKLTIIFISLSSLLSNIF